LDQPAKLAEGQRVRVDSEPASVTPTEKRSTTQKLLEIAGVIKDGPTDASRNHDHYLYGAPKREPEG
jgi:hypothetical protein